MKKITTLAAAAVLLLALAVPAFADSLGSGGSPPENPPTTGGGGTEEPGGELPGSETPGSETPGSETPGSETPGSETPTGGAGENVDSGGEQVVRGDTTQSTGDSDGQAAAEGELANTGVNAMTLALIAGSLLLAGGLGLVAARKAGKLN